MAEDKFKFAYIGLLFLLFLIPLGRYPISFSEALNLPQLVVLYTIFLLLIFIYWLYASLFKEKNNLARTNSLYAPLGLFFLLGVSSLMWTVSIPATYAQIFYFSFYLCAFFLSFNVVDNDKKREGFLRILLFSTFIVALYAIYQYFWGLEETRQYILLYGTEMPITAHKNFISRLNTDRAFSTFLYPNTLATFLMMVLPFPVFSAVFCGKENNGDMKFFIVKRVIFSALSLLILFAFVLTFSKGGTVVLFLSWFLFLLLKVPKSRKIIAVAGFVFLITFGIFFAYKGDYILEKLRPVKTSSGVRVEYWRAGLEMIKEKPLNGFGLGSFGRAYAKYKLPYAEETQAAHNDFLQVGAELGILGFLIFLSIFIFYFKEINTRIKNANNLSSTQKVFVYGGFVSCLSFALHSLGDFSFYVFGVTSVFFMIIGASLGVHSRQIKIKNKKAIFAPSLIIAVFIIILLLRVFTAEGHYLTAMNSKDFDEAIGELKLSTRYWTFGENEYRTSYHYVLSQMYKQKMITLNSDFSSEILKHLEQAVKYDSHRSLYWRELALMTSLFGNDKSKAIEYMRQAVSLYPALGENYLFFGDVHMIFGEKEEAVGQYNTALKYDTSLQGEIDKRIKDLGEK